MNISWLGLSAFEIKTKTSSGEITILTDPYQNTTGLRFPRTVEANIVTVSHKGDDADNIGAVTGDPFVVNMPGEYEVKDCFVFAISAPSKENPDNLFIRIENEQINIAHLGAIDRKLTNSEIEALENVDILMLPVGGGRVLSPKDADEIITQVEPRVIIPMTYGIPNLKEKLSGVDAFCKELGSCRKEEANKYKITRKDLPEEDRLIMVLSR